MLTDLHLLKYLQGSLSPEEEKEVEGLLEKNSDLQKRLDDLVDRGHDVTRPMWERTHLGKKSKRGSKVRYTTLLPGLLILVLILMLASHWFGKPGGNSTFIHAGGNGTAVEFLYYSTGGWRYIDAEFHPGDSLTFTVRDGQKYAIAVFGIYPGIPDPLTVEIWKSTEGTRFSHDDLKPVFSSKTSQPSPPDFLAVVYDTASMNSLTSDEIPALLRNGSGGGRMTALHYQVFRVPDR